MMTNYKDNFDYNDISICIDQWSWGSFFMLLNVTFLTGSESDPNYLVSKILSASYILTNTFLLL